MYKKLIIVSVVIILTYGVFFFFGNFDKKMVILSSEEENEREMFAYQRLKYEFEILKNPLTGEIPRNIRQKELAFAKTLPSKNFVNSGLSTPQNLNSYTPAGPNNIGGRTRALAIDARFGTGSNKVILSGSVSGGIYRSADGGVTWIKVNPENDIHNVTAIAQDPRPGFQDIWYAGGGEPIGNSASDIGAFYLGFGILKSTDNGVTWTRLTLNVSNTDGSALTAGTLEAFDNVFDIVHKIIVSPANGNVYIAGHRRLVRSADGGQTFKVVFGSNIPATADQGQMDIVADNSGTLFLAINGGNPDVALRGVWSSPSGNFNSWTKIAGGKTLGVDSLAGWRGNSYDASGSKRIVLALAPSQQNFLFAFYQNGLSQESSAGANPEADLFRIDVSTSTSLNLSANMPDFPGQNDGIDPLAVQGGYNMLVAVKPDDPNVVFVGGTNLYRSNDGFTTNTKTEWIGGYRKQNPVTPETYPASHADFHGLYFDPTNPNHAYAINDGGIQSTVAITANNNPLPVTWAMVTNYQTLQYNYVAIDPAPGQNNFLGGAQDNGTYFRTDGSPQPNDQFKISGGDGASVSIATVDNSTFTIYLSSQFGNLTRDVTNNFVDITPNNLTGNPDGGFGDFVTYFKSDFDNPQNLFYANYNRVFRTKNASTVTSSTWEEMTGISSSVNAANSSGTDVTIRSMELSRGPYIADHALYIGTSDAHIYRLNNPRDTASTAKPVDITPPGLTGNVSDIAVNPNNDNEILVTISNYSVNSIWYCPNAKSNAPSWKNVEGNLSLPSARSCMIVVKKDNSGNAATEYYVGTSVGLYSTTNINNGSVTWQREGDNILGMALVTTLDYRPQDNVLLVGTHGNGMFFGNTGTSNYLPNSAGGGVIPPGTEVLIQNFYPTPTNGTLNFTIGNATTTNQVGIRIYSMSGQLMYAFNRAYADGNINVSRLAAGMYIAKFTSDNGELTYTRRFIKY